MTFDYQYIDPGPDDPGCTKNRYFALNVSITYRLSGNAVLRMSIEGFLDGQGNK